MYAVIADPRIRANTHTHTHTHVYAHTHTRSKQTPPRIPLKFKSVVVDGAAHRKDLCPTGISSLTSGQDYFQLEGAYVCLSDLGKVAYKTL